MKYDETETDLQTTIVMMTSLLSAFSLVVIAGALVYMASSRSNKGKGKEDNLEREIEERKNRIKKKEKLIE